MAGISSNALKASNYGPNKYKYNRIENNNDFDLNLYETFFRILDPQIGSFFQLDPKTIFSESLYDAMGNNPVNNTDWRGNYFTWANQTVKDTYTNLRKENGNRISEYTKELTSLDLNSKDGKVQGRISELTTLINKHGELNSQWNEMESSAVEFNVTNNPSSPGVMGETSFDVDNRRVNVNLGAVGTDISIMAHEFRHGYGYLNGELLAVKRA